MTSWDNEPEPEAIKPTKAEIAEQNKQTEQKSFKFGKGIKSAFDIPVQNSTTVSIFGTFGSGKTHFATTAPTPVVFIDTEKRCLRIIKRLPAEKQKEMHVFDVMQYASVSNGDLNYSGMLDKFRSEIVGFVNELKNFDHSGTIVVDSMSDIIRWYAQWLETKPGLKRNPDGSVAPFERGKSKEQIRQIIDILKATGWNIIFTFKEKQKWGDAGPIEEYNPEWDKELGHACDFVINIRKIGEKRQYVLHKNSFGPTDIDIFDVDWAGFHNLISDHSGVIFE